MGSQLLGPVPHKLCSPGTGQHTPGLHTSTRAQGLLPGDQGAGVPAKAPVHLETGAHPRARVWIRGQTLATRNCAPVPRPQLTHTANTWAPDARPPGRAEPHAGPCTRIPATRAQPSTWTRRYAPGLVAAHAAPRDMPRRARRDRLAHPRPSRVRASRRDARTRAHPCPSCAAQGPPSRARGVPTRRGVPPAHPRGRAHLLRGRPRAAPCARPQEGPRKPAAHPGADRVPQLGASYSVSSFLGGKDGQGVGVAGGAAAWEPPRVLAPAALRSARAPPPPPAPPRRALQVPCASRAVGAGSRGALGVHDES